MMKILINAILIANIVFDFSNASVLSPLKNYENSPCARQGEQVSNF